MKKIIDDKGNDNGPFSSKKKADSKAESPSKDRLKADKFDLGINLTAKKTSLKHGSRRNLL